MVADLPEPRVRLSCRRSSRRRTVSPLCTSSTRDSRRSTPNCCCGNGGGGGGAEPTARACPRRHQLSALRKAALASPVAPLSPVLTSRRHRSVLSAATGEGGRDNESVLQAAAAGRPA